MNSKTKRITVIGMLCAITYVTMVVGRIPIQTSASTAGKRKKPLTGRGFRALSCITDGYGGFE